MSTIVLVQKDTNRHTEIVRELTAIGVERVLVLSLEAFLSRTDPESVDGILLDRGGIPGNLLSDCPECWRGPTHTDHPSHGEKG